MAHAGEKHGKRGCLCASYPLGMIVRDLGRASGFLKDRFNSIECKTHRAHPHSGTVAPAVVGLGRTRAKPVHERAAIARIGISSSDLSYGSQIIPIMQDSTRHGDGEHGIIGEAALRMEEREVLRLDRAVLINGPDDVARNGADHVFIPDLPTLHGIEALWLARASALSHTH